MVEELKLLFSRKEIAETVARLAREISVDYADKKLVARRGVKRGLCLSGRFGQRADHTSGDRVRQDSELWREKGVLRQDSGKEGRGDPPGGKGRADRRGHRGYRPEPPHFSSSISARTILPRSRSVPWWIRRPAGRWRSGGLHRLCHDRRLYRGLWHRF